MSKSPEFNSHYSEQTGHWARGQFDRVVRQDPNISRGQVEVWVARREMMRIPRDGKK